MGKVEILFKCIDIAIAIVGFLDYALGWEMLDNQKRNRVQNYYEYHYVFNYPLEFNHYIRSTLTLLLQEQSKLIEQTEKHTVSLSIR